MLRSATFLFKILFIYFTQQVTLIRRSTVLSLPLQLVFPGRIIPRVRGRVNTIKLLRKKIMIGVVVS
jgi:hypothetical protein